MRKRFVFVIALITAGVAYAEPLSPTELLPELRKGGYILFIRHPKTNPDQADTDPLHLDNIQAQRQLSDEGRKQATTLGEAFRALKLPIDLPTLRHALAKRPALAALATQGRIGDLGRRQLTSQRPTHRCQKRKFRNSSEQDGARPRSRASAWLPVPARSR